MLEYGSISKTEKALGYGKDTLRKKINREGYTFNKNTKQYELLESEEGVKSKEERVKPVSPTNAITQVVTGSYMPKIKQNESIFSNREIGILYKLIKEYELKEQIRLTDEEKGKLDNRNIRVYVEHFNKFAGWCKVQGITQADALFEAINLLMKKY